jgi:hypothetical protein
MNWKQPSRKFTHALIYCSLCQLIWACGSLMAGSDTKTEFLDACSQNAQCAGDAVCRCGVCTFECDDDDDCSLDNVQGRCSTSDSCLAVAVCLPVIASKLDDAALPFGADASRADLEVGDTSESTEPSVDAIGGEDTAELAASATTEPTTSVGEDTVELDDSATTAPMASADDQTECVSEPAYPNDGMFVSPNGSDDEQCGSISQPCATISRGLTRAKAEAADMVFLAQGVYTEYVQIDAPVSLIGGWLETPDEWNRDCGVKADTTIVNSTEATGVSVQLSGLASLRSMTISTKERDESPGESRYGVRAMGAQTAISLEDVVINAAGGNHGQAGASGTTLLTADCHAGFGADGSAAQAAPSTPPGRFTSEGYSTGDGSNGFDGMPGENGAPGGDVTGSCMICNSECTGVAGFNQTAKGGANGCGGSSGSGGSGGGGGGSSVGIFSWLAAVELNDYVFVNAGDGGNGGVGGRGGAGQPGTAASESETVECNPSLVCTEGSYCNDDVTGEPGTKGGNGSSGAKGGDGAGGWSVALAGTPSAFIGFLGASLSSREPGVSLGAGPAGQAHDVLEVE